MSALLTNYYGATLLAPGSGYRPLASIVVFGAELKDIPWSVTMPVALIVVALAGLLIFRGHVGKLIDRTKKLGRRGAEFESNQSVVVSAPQLSFEQLMREPVSASILKREEFIRNQMGQFALKTDEERITVLVRGLAAARVTGKHAIIGFTIFGSQLELLLALNAAEGGLPVGAAQGYWERARAAFPDIFKSSTFELWIGYLQTMECVQIVNGKYVITTFGSDFLKYLIESRATYYRRG